MNSPASRKVMCQLLHDQKNHLMIAVLAAGLLLNETDPDARARLLTMIEENVLLAGEIADDLQLMALGLRRDPPAAQDPVRPITRCLCSLKGSGAVARVTLHWAIDSALGQVRMRPLDWTRLVNNLVCNAARWSRPGGQVMVIVEPVQVQVPQVLEFPIGVLPAGRYVKLTVVDRGCGISVKVKARLFHEFITTKQEGHGHGIGLTGVAGLVAERGGWLEILTAPGEGTRVTVYLPIVETSGASSAAGLKAAA